MWCSRYSGNAKCMTRSVILWYVNSSFESNIMCLVNFALLQNRYQKVWSTSTNDSGLVFVTTWQLDVLLRSTKMQRIMDGSVQRFMTQMSYFPQLHYSWLKGSWAKKMGSWHIRRAKHLCKTSPTWRLCIVSYKHDSFECSMFSPFRPLAQEIQKNRPQCLDPYPKYAAV